MQPYICNSGSPVIATRAAQWNASSARIMCIDILLSPLPLVLELSTFETEKRENAAAHRARRLEALWLTGGLHPASLRVCRATSFEASFLFVLLGSGVCQPQIEFTPERISSQQQD